MKWLRNFLLGKDFVNAIEQKAAPFQMGVRYSVSNNGVIISPDANKAGYIRDGYSVNDIIYSVTQLILDKVRLPEWGLYKVVKPSSLKKYRQLMNRKNLTGKDFQDALRFKEEGLEPLTSYNLQQGKLNNLLTYPNDEYTFQDLVVYGNLFKLLTGDTFIWGDILKAGANTGIPNSLWILPSHKVTIKATNDFPRKAGAYQLFEFNQEFTPEQIVHLKYPNPNWTFNGSELYGFAPLQAFMKNTNRNNSAKDASYAKYQNNGMEGVLYFDDPRFTPEQGMQQINALKIKLAEEYAGPTNQGKVGASGYKTGWIPMGLSPVDLGIIDSEKWDALMFCNGYGVPPELLGLTQKTYNNVKEAEKALTTRSAIPLLTDMRNYLNWKISTDWGFKGQNVYIDYDTECFTELQVDITEIVAWTSKLIAISPNEERELVGMESDPAPIMDEKWVLSGNGRVPLSDYQQSVIDQTLMNEQQANANGQGNQQNGNAASSANGKGKTGVYQ